MPIDHPVDTDLRASPSRILPVWARGALFTTSILVFAVAAWQSLPRIGDRTEGLEFVRWAGPTLALGGAVLGLFGHRWSRGHRPGDRWCLAGAVLILLIGSAAMAGLLSAIRLPLHTAMPS
jgi:hypothetical protein